MYKWLWSIDNKPPSHAVILRSAATKDLATEIKFTAARPYLWKKPSVKAPSGKTIRMTYRQSLDAIP
jgi:hypothetical protein